MTETYTAVVDRIVDGETAVLLLEADESESEFESGSESESESESETESESRSVVDERVLDVERLPEDGRHEGAVFDVELADDRLESMTYRPAVERDRREAAQDRFDRLSERLSDE